MRGQRIRERQDLRDFANALREVLGLGPLEVHACERKAQMLLEQEDVRRFYVGEWSEGPMDGRTRAVGS